MRESIACNLRTSFKLIYWIQIYLYRVREKDFIKMFIL